MFITSKNKYLLNDMKIFRTCSIPLTCQLIYHSDKLYISFDTGGTTPIRNILFVCSTGPIFFMLSWKYRMQLYDDNYQIKYKLIPSNYKYKLNILIELYLIPIVGLYYSTGVQQLHGFSELSLTILDFHTRFTIIIKFLTMVYKSIFHKYKLNNY